MTKRVKEFVAISCVFLLFSEVGFAQPSMNCGNIRADAGGYGPYDYSNPSHREDRLPLVAKHHFTESIAMLDHSNPGQNIDYTLRRFPNHHRALDAMGRLAIREKTNQPEGSRYPIQCWFQRAKEFAPDDPIVHMVHGMYLNRAGNLDEAIEEMERAHEMDPGHPNINYNLGILYLEKSNYEQARFHARKAYDQGFPLPGLRKRLQSAGEWD